MMKMVALPGKFQMTNFRFFIIITVMTLILKEN